jgi:hypothetical protein
MSKPKIERFVEQKNTIYQFSNTISTRMWSMLKKKRYNQYNHG